MPLPESDASSLPRRRAFGPATAALAAAALTALVFAVLITETYAVWGVVAFPGGPAFGAADVLGVFLLYWLACWLVLRAAGRQDTSGRKWSWAGLFAVGIAFALPIVYHDVVTVWGPSVYRIVSHQWVGPSSLRRSSLPAVLLVRRPPDHPAR